ncbi:MAG: 16S rRNA (guanine(966)-N(2))-methyltransferase RsmD [Bifidobacteriaceae bacterium]|nr:16S rRNA (guanine(966)-N(2))-methyltransferase RsmD [Bifidobacteriaceae bacterium]
MTRIIAGSARGRELKVPAKGTRPTSARVREAMFSLLEARLGGPGGWNDLAVLDLYAGSGSLGLEAASRGASRVVLVDSARAAARVAQANAAALGLDDVVTVLAVKAEAVAAGARLPGLDQPFDLVLLDPPYAVGPAELGDVLAGLAAHKLVLPDSLVVQERAKKTVAPPWPHGWEVLPPRTYGDTVLHLAQVCP